jgi:hypothetical protein
MLVLFGIVGVVLFMIVGILATWAAWMRGQRSALMPKVAAEAGLRYSEFDLFNSAAVPFPLFRQGDGRRIQNLMWRDGQGHPRVFEYGFFTIYKDKNGNQYQRWQWFACALVQHNGKWPEIHLTKEKLIDRAAQTLGLPDIELESEEFNRTFVVQCENAKFATDLLDPQMMEFIVGTRGKVDVQTKGRFLLLTTAQLEAPAMVGLLGLAEGIVARVPAMVWDVYGRFPDGMGTEEMPPPPTQLRTEDGGLFGTTGKDTPAPFEFAPGPRLGSIGDAWDPTPDVDYDLDGNPVPRPVEDPWGEGRG